MLGKSKNNTTKEQFGKTSRVVEGTKIKGDITSTTDFRLDGELIGNFTSQGKLVIGESGKLVGSVICKNFDIEGNYQGKAEVIELLSVRSKAKIKGEMLVGKLAVEPGADFGATCQMKGGIKNINANSKTEGKAV